MRDIPKTKARLLRRCLLAPLFLLAGFFAPPALALQDFCVDSNALLDAALQDYLDEGEDTIVRLVQGTYAIRPEVAQFDNDLTLIGGYADASCTARSVDPALTVLRPAIGESLTIYADNLSLNSLSFRDFGGEVYLSATGPVFANARLDAARLRFEGPAVLGNVLSGEEVSVTDVLVHSSGGPDTAAERHCALTIRSLVDSDDALTMNHSTIAHNPANGLCIGWRRGSGDGGAAVRLDNNIFWGNGLDLDIAGTSNHVRRNNTLSSVSVEFAGAASSSGSLSFDPLFVNPAAKDFRLQNASTAINSGLIAPSGGLPQYDISGNPRHIGPAPDRGAYESAVTGVGGEILVTRNDDGSGIGTLRWALNQANADPDYSVIRFNIPGACPRVIAPDSELPLILSHIGIDGYSQPGSAPNTAPIGKSTNATICVSLTGINGLHYGLRLPQAAGSTAQLGVSGMAFSFFSEAGIALEAGQGSSIAGNEFLASPLGVFVRGSAEQTAIGGADAWRINLFGPGLRDYAIALNWPSTRSRVENNLIGLKASGNEATGGNGVGVGISSHDNVVVDNAISGTSSPLALFDASRNQIRDNVLGRRVGFQFCPGGGCDNDLSNSSHGVLIQGSSSDNRISGNQIANSGGAGIRQTGGQRNSFIGNSIWDNAGLAVDLGSDGPEPLDYDGSAAAAAQPNRGINAPVLLIAGGPAQRGSVSGRLLTNAGEYLVEAFIASDCISGTEARQPAGWALVTVGSAPPGVNGLAAFNLPLRPRSPLAQLTNARVTAIATQIGGAHNGASSELSACRTYQLDSIFLDGFD
ncbi:NosD domain-containing protein [Tahibacter harae]|uniref:Right-handed parallel beta-helix repeat-containing protein n=1 Tax=Tahibacter harae TaxID=2963937 RepID=A0ABT1QUH9_9GAMM|nr:right-handed parallel beta-helix repeat-containing protein [Tahibacter harae]MCQ4165943.1 right-handed parallel beta-helix repeat-containing protein [Tahibacter harae]